ncbi:hypothetical protein HHI36_022770 [Cryptolaemus montrouzieri]|uniref:SWIM-type domain-containing protein n=1 Tax=Cryptolaemus montrouzieri TaxID=559131 RepID=A0ABD2PF18_9CUCU
MTSKHVLNLSSILEFFKDDAKLVARGENAVESGHVKDMAFDGELLIICGNVLASMRDRLYKVEIKLDTDKCIEEVSCTGPRGQLVCHHMAALSIFGYHNISVTDITCTWKSRKPHTNAVQTGF